METPEEQEKGKARELFEKVDWKDLGLFAIKETGRVALNVLAMFGALMLAASYAKGGQK
jgi:hypothetical protein